MLSSLIRAMTRAFVRVLVIALASALICGSFSFDAIARVVDRTPCELPGDGDDVNGYKDYEFVAAPSGEVGQQSIDHPMPPDHEKVLRVMRTWRALLIIQLYVTTRK